MKEFVNELLQHINEMIHVMITLNHFIDDMI